MANNRMYLRHKRTGKQVFLAKYYPSSGWFRDHDHGDLTDKLNELFDDPRHIEGSDFGENDYELVYEENKPRSTTEIEAEIRKLQDELYGTIGEGIRELGIKTPACFESPHAD